MKKITLTDKTVGGFLWMVSGSGAKFILKIGVLAVLARLVSPEAFGLIGAALVVEGFSMLFTQMGVGPAIVQRKDLKEAHVSTGFTLTLLMGVSFMLILILLSPIISDFFRMKELVAVLYVISIVFLLQSLILVPRSLLQRELKFKLISIIEVTTYAIGYGIIGIILGVYNFGVWALVGAHLSQSILQVVLFNIVQSFPKRLNLNFIALKELMYLGGGFTLAKIFNYLALQGDNIVIGRLLGATALGLYGRAYAFMVMPVSLFGSALDQALFPAMAKVQGDKVRLGKAYLKGVSTITIIALPIGIFITILSPEIVGTLLGPQWDAVILPLQILSLGLLFRMSYKISDSLARATGDVYKRAWRQFIYAASIFLTTWVGHNWGLPGVSIGVVISLIINYTLMAHLSLKITGIKLLNFIKVHVNGIKISMVTGITTYLIANLMRSITEIDILILTLSSFAFVSIIFVTTKVWPSYFLGEDGKWLKKNLLNKLPNKLKYILN